jgi:hypothetical protein
MKKSLILFLGLIITVNSLAQVAYMQFRTVPLDRQEEFVEKETKYWSKVAKSAIDKGQMAGWSLWRKVGITTVDAPNYVLMNTFESIDKMDPAAIWSESNMNTMGVSPDMVETQSFAPSAFDYWLQFEASVGGDFKYVVVNYASPQSRGAFIEENKTLWQPFHEKNIMEGSMGITSWGVLSVIAPTGNQTRFSVLTWDGFNKMSDAMKYKSYTSPENTSNAWKDVLSKTKMAKIMPDGFEYSIIYELVMRISPEPKK